MTLFRSCTLASVAVLMACGGAEVVDTGSDMFLLPSVSSVETARQAGAEWWASLEPAADMTDDELREVLILNDYSELEVEALFSGALASGGDDNLWRTRNHKFGFFSGLPDTSGGITLRDAFAVPAEDGLKGQRVKITLDRVRIERYPGKGEHNIAFVFSGQTQVGRTVVPLQFGTGFTARQGDEPGITGKSIFVGLNVGTEGVNLKGSTINVNTKKDKTFFSILTGAVFSQGLKLLNSFQPALAPLTQLAAGVKRELEQKDKGITVQVFDMGLDFSNLPGRIKLAQGEYVIVQMPPEDEATWSWDEWEFKDGGIRRRDDFTKRIPYNYLTIGISHFVDTLEN